VTARVLVVDDSPPFVEATIAALKIRGIDATGCDAPEDVLRWRQDRYSFDLVLLDMRLGETRRGGALNAAKLLPLFATYGPSAKVLVFSQEDVTLEECMACIGLGAIGVLPKGADADALAAVAKSAVGLGDRLQALEQVIRLLWGEIDDRVDVNLAGQALEMLIINLFNSMHGFTVLDSNIRTDAGEIDVLVRNDHSGPVWDILKSHHVVIECKNRKRKLDLQQFNQLAALVRTRGALGGVGIAVTTYEATSEFRKAAARHLADDGCWIFHLNRAHLEQLVGCPAAERDGLLETIFERQLAA